MLRVSWRGRDRGAINPSVQAAPPSDPAEAAYVQKPELSGGDGRGISSRTCQGSGFLVVAFPVHYSEAVSIDLNPAPLSLC